MPYKFNPLSEEFDYYEVSPVNAETPQTINHSGITDIVMGSISDIEAIRIFFAATRGALKQTGTFDILNKTSSVTYSFPLTIGDNIGMSMAASINGTDIELNLTVDASSTDNIDFNYNLQIIES